MSSAATTTCASAVANEVVRFSDFPEAAEELLIGPHWIMSTALFNQFFFFFFHKTRFNNSFSPKSANFVSAAPTSAPYAMKRQFESPLSLFAAWCIIELTNDFQSVASLLSLATRFGRGWLLGASDARPLFLQLCASCSRRRFQLRHFHCGVWWSLP